MKAYDQTRKPVDVSTRLNAEGYKTADGVSFKTPKNAWESDPFFGSILMIVMGAAIRFPMAIFSWTFGRDAAPWIFLTGCVLFWIFEIWTAFKPFNLD